MFVRWPDPALMSAFTTVLPQVRHVLTHGRWFTPSVVVLFLGLEMFGRRATVGRSRHRRRRRPVADHRRHRDSPSRQSDSVGEAIWRAVWQRRPCRPIASKSTSARTFAARRHFRDGLPLVFTDRWLAPGDLGGAGGGDLVLLPGRLAAVRRSGDLHRLSGLDEPAVGPAVRRVARRGLFPDHAADSTGSRAAAPATPKIIARPARLPRDLFEHHDRRRVAVAALADARVCRRCAG